MIPFPPFLIKSSCCGVNIALNLENILQGLEGLSCKGQDNDAVFFVLISKNNSKIS